MEQNNWKIIQEKLGRRIFNCYSLGWKTKKQVSEELGFGENPNRHVYKYTTLFLKYGYLDEKYVERKEKGIKKELRYRKLRAWKANINPFVDYFGDKLPYMIDIKKGKKVYTKRVNLNKEDIDFMRLYLKNFWISLLDLPYNELRDEPTIKKYIGENPLEEHNQFEIINILLFRIFFLKGQAPSIGAEKNIGFYNKLFKYAEKYKKSSGKSKEKIILKVKKECISFSKKDFKNESPRDWELIFFALAMPNSLCNLLNNYFERLGI